MFIADVETAEKAENRTLVLVASADPLAQSDVRRHRGGGATGGRKVKQLLGDDAREGHARVAELIQTHRYHLSSPGEAKVSGSSSSIDACPIEGPSHLPQYACMLSHPRSVRPALP